MCSGLERSQSRLEENGAHPNREGTRAKIALMGLPVLKRGCGVLLQRSGKMQC